ncbi:Acyl-CoA hydrolase [Malonomonas rubra DSM 5091]|uniref:Acyl-CoA hydrolase n=1 Tax=Malonomonas rubra DSM 5091 TaxID=1122189 RepID=A0A1M6F6U2_MALRU|nr:hotdog domain-containing protein [Malonomonas rubra]SHI93417.1 Acyl-CoA hydrolase [Malonomonas rubra DSM 5091]
MDTFTLVRTEHLNHHGYLFGGAMLKWVDENAWVAATRDFPGCKFVTISMDACHFKSPVENGAILRFTIDKVDQGKTSVSYLVNVFADEPGATCEKEVFSTTVKFVRLDETGEACALPE